MLFVYRDIEIN